MGTWTVSRRSPLLRVYAWIYGADTRTATFCKLFWGILLAPVALLLKPFGLATLAGLDRFMEWMDRRSYRKLVRTGKPWNERHPHLVAWTESDKWWVRWWLAIAIAAVVTVFDAIYDPWALAGYLPITALMIYALERMRKRKGQPGFLITGLRSLKDRTCPHIEVK